MGVLVFDLDNTLWQPELYQMRGKKPKANKDIKLTAGALDALHDLAGDGWEKTQAAVASRALSLEAADPVSSIHSLFKSLPPARAPTRLSH